MNIKKKLLNPFALAAQGFAVGAILFWPQPDSNSQASPPAPQVQSALLQQIPGA